MLTGNDAPGAGASEDDLLETLLHGEASAEPQRQAAEPRRQAAESRRSRPLRPRRAQKRALAAIRQGYEFSGLLLAELAALMIWLAFWCANGFFTTLFVQALARRAVEGLNLFIALNITPDFQINLSAGAAWGLGLLAHLIITLIELHLWRSGRRGTYPMIIAVGVVDVFTSAIGLQSLGAALGLPVSTLAAVTIYVILAELIAIIPERRIVDHASAMVLMLRRQPSTAPAGG